MTKVTARRVALGGAVMFVVLGAAFVAMPGFIRDRINASLAEMPDGYRGHAERVSLHPLSLALHLEDFRIEKREGGRLPYMRMEALVAEVVPAPGLWPQLELRFVKPQINFVDAPSPGKQQWGPHIDLAELKQKLTLQLRRVVVEDGEVHLRHFSAEPPVDVYATHVNVLFDELTDCLPPSTSCHAKLMVRGRPMARSALSAQASLEHEQSSERPDWRFDMNALVKDLELRRVNSALIHYAKLDVQKGKASLKLALHQHDAHLYGSLRPLLSGVDVVGKRDAHSKLGPELAAGLAAHFVEKRKGKVVLRFEKRGRGELTGRLEVDDEAPGELGEQASLER